MPVTDQAFVTLATNDIYCQGALVLGQSLRNHGTSRKLVMLVTAEVTHGIRTVLGKVFDEVIEVSTLDSADLEHLALMRRPELGLTFTKLHCWTLTQYSKCVFMDADTLVLCNVDELFDRDELSAAPDSGWPDCFNSGVFVFRPSLETYARLIQFAVEHGSFDGGDQGLLNSFFSDWATTDISKHLPFIYNLSSSTLYTYSPAFRQFGADAKVVHFLGSSKPWHCKYNPQTRTVTEDGSPSGHQHLTFTTLWWEIYTASVFPLLTGQAEMADTGGQEKHRFGGIEVVMKRERLPPAHVHSLPPEPPARHANPDHLDRPTNEIMHNQVREGGSLTSCLLPGCCPTWGLPTSSHGSTSTHRPQATRENPSAAASSFQQQLVTPETVSPEVPVCEPSEPVPLSSASCVDIPTSEPSSPTSLQSDCQAMFSTDSSLSEPASDTQTWAYSSPEPVLQESLELGTLAASVTELSIQAVDEIEPRSEEERRKWEEGQMDYMGKDAFENIKKRLDRFLQ